jgi:hypothetical protein
MNQRGILFILVVLAWTLSGCANWLAAVPTATPHAFVTATPRPTTTPTAVPDTPRPARTPRNPTASATPTVPQTGTPTPTATLIPTATIAGVADAPCAHAPDGVFNDVYQSDPGLPTAMGCPTAPPDSDESPRTWAVQIIYQPFERGAMLWLSNLGWYEGKVVYVLLDDSTYNRHDDTYDPSFDPEAGGSEPPAEAGQLRPTRALGKVWRETPGLADRIGFATAPEAELLTYMQMFEYGEMVNVPPASAVFVFKRGEPDTWSMYGVPGG